jgi:tetratricopeptide (TPR) repeat protein
MHADTLPALSAVARFPHLHQQVAAAIDAQQRRVSDCAASFIPRPDQDEAIDVAITTVSGGLIAIEGPPGAGVTSLLCALAARYNAPIWLPGDDHGMGIAALCAQLIALHNLPVALVTPGAGRDSTTLERLLTEVVAGREAQEPLVVVIDDISGDRAMPRPPPFPLTLPASVVILYGSAPGHAPPLRPIQRITLPKAGAALREQLIMVALRSGASQTQAASIADCADGSFLYAHLAARLIAQGLLNLSSLPQGLDQLYSFWWSGLEPISRRFFELIAAAGESVEPEYLSTLLDVSTDAVQRLLAPWRLLISEEGGKIRLQHSATSRWIETAGRLARAHTLYAKNLAAQAAERRYVSQGYPITQLARHIALSDAATRDSLAPSLEERTWVLAQERRTGTMEVSAHDLRWALSAAQGSTPLRLVRTAALAGTLALMARRMLPDAPSAALTETLANGAPRDLSLRRARALIDQLPNGRDKALALRRLGETCYTLRMRAPAMRMLSEALDLEIQGMPRSWRDEREELLVALARAAIAHGASHIALGITTLIAHTERRGLVDTEVVRYLLAHGEFTRAEEVAYAIGHAGSHEWALAEVAVGHARVSDPARASFIIATLKTATAIAWAHTELARDAARAGDPQAVATVQAIEHTLLRDRALSQVAQAYAEGAAGARAYDTALLIRDLELRARALIHVAELDSAIAEQALLEAARVTDSIQGEERITVIAALAAAHAALGSLDRALQAADGIPPWRSACST